MNLSSTWQRTVVFRYRPDTGKQCTDVLRYRPDSSIQCTEGYKVVHIQVHNVLREIEIPDTGIQCTGLSDIDHGLYHSDTGIEPQQQYCGSMIFWSGSGSADPCLRLMDLDPSIFITDLQDANKNLIFKSFFCILLFEGTFTSFFQDKKSKEVLNQ
jgi:hypothetical protein